MMAMSRSGSSDGVKSRIRLLVVRHGETDCNVQGIIQGQLDTDLNATGREQARHVGKALAAEHIDEMYTSPLRRARDTADAIAAAHPRFSQKIPASGANGSNDTHVSSNGASPQNVKATYWLDDRLKERGFGVLEGKQLDRSKPRRDSTQGMEQMSDFTTRLAAFLADVLLRPAPFGQSATAQKVTRLATHKIKADPLEPVSDGLQQAHLNTSGCSRTIVLVAHGAAISALVGGVMMDTGLAVLGAGVSRTRVWNCSITEIIVNLASAEAAAGTDGHDLPLLRTSDEVTRADLVTMLDQCKRGVREPFVIERWADVRHLPDSIDDAVAAKGAADEEVARQAS